MYEVLCSECDIHLGWTKGVPNGYIICDACREELIKAARTILQ